MIDLLALLNSASAAIENHNYTAGVVDAWTVCEVLLDRLWVAHIDAFATGFRKKVADNDAYTAAAKLQVLAMAGGLDVDLLRKLDAVRVARNKWVHQMTAVPGHKPRSTDELGASRVIGAAAV